MPSKLLFEEAASVPLAALTAYQALFEAGKLEKGATVLVHAAAGGVGHFAVQLAKDAGARVLGTAGAGNHEFVLGLGADTVIDYAREDFVEASRRVCPEGVDLVLDGIGGETQTRSLDALRPGGTMVSIVGREFEKEAESRGFRAGFVFVRPDVEQLDELGRMVDSGRLRTHVSRIYPLAEAVEAQKEIQAGHVKGKLVLAL
jgi:NADPH:quinone reductase-like Zn-dependent oxidoreductase